MKQRRGMNFTGVDSDLRIGLVDCSDSARSSKERQKDDIFQLDVMFQKDLFRSSTMLAFP